VSAAGYSHLMSWISSSVAEAARLHHREVDADHLLLGLIAQGGRAAQVLGCHGVSLATARQALAEVSRGDLAGISIDPATVPLPAPLTPSEILAHQHHGEIPLGEGVRRLVGSKETSLTTSLGALQALLADRGAGVARVLSHLGVDLEALGAELGEVSEEPDPVARQVQVDRTLLPRDAAAVGVTCFVSAPSRDVLAVLADPAALSGWAVDRGDITATHADGVTVRYRSRLRRRHQDLRWVLRDGQGATWLRVLLGGPRDGAVLSYDHLEVAPAQGGSLVTLSRGYRPWRFLGRPGRHLADVAARTGVVNAVPALARTVAARC